MIVYLESSAVLSWLLGEPDADRVTHVLAQAERVTTSALTSVECARALVRARHSRRLTPSEELATREILETAERSWDVLSLGDDVLQRARAPLPADPVRTLDALHVCSAMLLRDTIGPLAFVSLDVRVRSCAEQQGFVVLP
jgi:predicted nucleic acid-binding protein